MSSETAPTVIETEPGISTLDSDGIVISVSYPHAQSYLAVAVLVDSAFSRMMGNLLNGLKSLARNVKLFTARSRAKEWLLSLKDASYD